MDQQLERMASNMRVPVEELRAAAEAHAERLPLLLDHQPDPPAVVRPWPWPLVVVRLLAEGVAGVLGRIQDPVAAAVMTVMVVAVIGLLGFLLSLL